VRNLEDITRVKKEYFYGLKVNIIATVEGQPIEVLISPRCYHDLDPFKLMNIDLPPESSFYGDSAYTHYEYEDKLKQKGIRVIIERKANSCKPYLFEDWQDLKCFRRKIETTFSRISAWLPKKIHAITQAGFELKVMKFIITLSKKFIMN
jgi:hypothetical protein